MFTGIITHQGTIQYCECGTADSLNLRIACSIPHVAIGESIAVDGICLTATEQSQEGILAFDLSAETIAKTRAAYYQVGNKVNLERALRLGDAMGGHWVSGHVDTVLTVQHLEKRDDYLCIDIHFEPAQRSLLLPKGSITIDGVSLTLNEIHENSFQLMIIPHTLKETNLSRLHVGDKVNVEFDWMVKAIAHQMQLLREQESVMNQSSMTSQATHNSNLSEIP